MTKPKQDYKVIECMLSLLQLLHSQQLELDDLINGEAQERFAAQLGAGELETARGLLAFMDEIPGGFLIYLAGAGEQILYANRGLLRIFRCETIQEFRKWTNNSFRGLVHPDDLDEVEESIKHQIANSQYDLDYVEYRITRRDGSIGWIEDYGHFIRTKAVGDLFYVFLGDATEKHNRQLQERESLLQEKWEEERKLQSLIAAYDEERSQINQEHLRRLEVIEGLSVNYESILYVDLDQDRIQPYRLSNRTEPLFGENLLTREYSQFMLDYVAAWVHPEDRDLVARATSPDYIRQRLSSGVSYYVNYRVLSGAAPKYLQLRLVNAGRNGHSGQIVIGCRWVDEELQREMEQKQLLAEALTNANLAIDAKNTFLSNMSHDMRTPLNAIFGFTALARKNLADPAAVEGYLGRVETSSQQLLDLIDKLLEMSWTGSSAAHLAEIPCNLRQILKDVENAVLPQARNSGLTLLVNCREVENSAIYGDPNKLRQLLQYLVNNALTYTEPGGQVTLTVTQLEKLSNAYALYQFVVEDTGVGISREFLEHIFEPFAREKNTTYSGIHGVGLGLTIAKNIVDMMGGNIRAESEVGTGSTFTITLRLRTQTQQPRAAAIIPAEKPTVERILLVEDNAINLEIETEILEELGFIVETAVDGSVAVEKITQSPAEAYDLILMDIQMPIMDGWQAARAIRRLEDPVRANIPIIALSANVFESDIKKSLESGMDAHLAKPIDIPLLLKTMEEVMGRRFGQPT